MSTTPSVLVRIPAPIYTLIYLGVALAVERHAPRTFAVIPLGATLVLASLILAQWAMGMFRLEKTTIVPSATTNAALIVEGPFRFTRNPLYLSLLIASFGIAFMIGRWPLFAVPVLLFVTLALVTVPFEEAQMERQFGERYRAYKARVRRWL